MSTDLLLLGLLIFVGFIVLLFVGWIVFWAVCAVFMAPLIVFDEIENTNTRAYRFRCWLRSVTKSLRLILAWMGEFCAFGAYPIYQFFDL